MKTSSVILAIALAACFLLPANAMARGEHHGGGFHNGGIGAWHAPYGGGYYGGFYPSIGLGYGYYGYPNYYGYPYSYSYYSYPAYSSYYYAAPVYTAPVYPPVVAPAPYSGLLPINPYPQTYY